MHILLTGGNPFYAKTLKEVINLNKACDIKYDFNVKLTDNCK